MLCKFFCIGLKKALLKKLQIVDIYAPFENGGENCFPHVGRYVIR